MIELTRLIKYIMDKEKTTIGNKLICLVILAFFFALPFERIPTLELSGFTVKASYLIGIAIITLFLTGFSKIYLKNWQKSDKLLFIFWLYAFFTIFWTNDLKKSLVISLLWLFVFLIYLILKKYLTIHSSILKKIEDSVLVSAVLVCLFGIFQFVADSLGIDQSITGLRYQYTKAIMGFPRIQSVALEPLYFSNFLLVPFFILLRRYFSEKKFFSKYFWLTILILINIILGISRGAYLALAISLVLLIITVAIYYKQYLQKVWGLLIILIVASLLSAFLVYGLNGREASSNFADHTAVDNVQTDGSALDRVSSYSQAVNLYKSNPIFGIGLGNFGILMTPKENINKSGYAIVNNEYLEILVETGIIGFLLFLAFIIFYLKELSIGYQNANPDKKLTITFLFLGVFAIFIQYNFFSTLYIIHIWAFLALLKGEAEN